MALRIARTNAEAHLYMDLHPCGCGEIRFPRSSSVLETSDGDLASHYTGVCPRDGAPREFTFRLPPEILMPPADESVRYGGPEPSELIDPGEWLNVADAYARSVPAGAASPAPGAASPPAGAMLRRAIAAIDEVLKFIPGVADRVPEQAFVSDVGRAAYAKEPGRFRRPRLEAVRGAYVSALVEIDGVGADEAR
jgi:hypothetical protein